MTFSEEAFNFFDNDELSYDIWNNKYRYNDESFQKWVERVSGNNKYIGNLILEKKFLFAGRTLINRGTNNGSYANCYSIGFIDDSLDKIMEANTQLAMTYKSQGGQGLSLSKIRPKGTLIKSGYASDGIIPFMEIFNTTTNSISQGGSRKGALLMSLDVRHAEIENFISIKSNEQKIDKANLSVEIDDEFMKIIEHYYSTELEQSYLKTKIEKPILHEEKNYEGKIVKYDIDPVSIYEKIIENAYKYAEPGVIFTNQFRNYNLMEYVDDYNIETCNPCGEQPLPKHGACNLCSINLSEYVVNPFTKQAYIDYDTLAFDIFRIVEAMDDIVDENLNNHALEAQKTMSMKYRNIGIGIMGLADMFIKLGIVYGSKESVLLINNLMPFIFTESLVASSELAKIRGNFPGYNKAVWDATIIKQNVHKDLLKSLKKDNCLRNCSLLSIAPTGSIGTLLGVSTGIEPHFALSYKRKTISLNKNKETIYDINIKVLNEYNNYNLNDKNVEVEKTFVTAKDVNWIDRINLQAEIQKCVDTAISSTINLSQDISLEEIKMLYLYAWQKRLKGITIYREGSRSPILSQDFNNTFKFDGVIKRPKELQADFYLTVAQKEQYIVLIGLLENKPYEIFTFRTKENEKLNIPQHKGKIIKLAKNHYCFKSDYITIDQLQNEYETQQEKMFTLFTSMLLRHNAKIKFIIKTIKKINNDISSFISAMCRILNKYTEIEHLDIKCPECGRDLIKEGGCVKCSICTYSKCE